MNPTSIKHNGEEHSIEEWSAIYGLNPDTFLESLKNNGFNIDRALNASGQKSPGRLVSQVHIHRR